MKIYTEVQNHYGKLYLGTVLVSDQDQIYMANGNELQTKDIDQAYINGVRRALCFVKCNKPLYANGDITIYTSKHYQKPYDSDVFEEKLMNDEYIQNFVNERGLEITHNKDEFNEFDKQMLLNASNQIRWTQHNQFMRKMTDKVR